MERGTLKIMRPRYKTLKGAQKRADSIMQGNSDKNLTVVEGIALTIGAKNPLATKKR
jgi:hypothetical protein